MPTRFNVPGYDNTNIIQYRSDGIIIDSDNQQSLHPPHQLWCSTHWLAQAWTSKLYSRVNTLHTSSGAAHIGLHKHEPANSLSVVWFLLCLVIVLVCCCLRAAFLRISRISIPEHPYTFSLLGIIDRGTKICKSMEANSIRRRRVCSPVFWIPSYFLFPLAGSYLYLFSWREKVPFHWPA